jgi:hypothetical protein
VLGLAQSGIETAELGYIGYDHIVLVPFIGARSNPAVSIK